MFFSLWVLRIVLCVFFSMGSEFFSLITLCVFVYMGSEDCLCVFVYMDSEDCFVCFCL